MDREETPETEAKVSSLKALRYFQKYKEGGRIKENDGEGESNYDIL
jgi:hypothetical protein